MKKIINFIAGLMLMFTLSSCITTAQAQSDFDGEVDASIVISYGTPYYVDNMVRYYFYRGWYYYPYMLDNRYYFHRYRRVLPYDEFSRWYRPIPRDYVHPRPHYRNHRTYHHRFPVHSYDNRRSTIHHNVTPRRSTPNMNNKRGGGNRSNGHFRGKR